jgi:hypothetical protein
MTIMFGQNVNSIFTAQGFARLAACFFFRQELKLKTENIGFQWAVNVLRFAIPHFCI